MKRRQKLAVQVILIVSVMLVIALALIGTVVTQGTKRMFIQSNNERITKELEECKYLLMNPEIVGWVLDQWEADPDMVRGPRNKLEEEIYDDFVFSRFTAELEDLETLETMEPETRRSYLKTLYQFLAAWINDKRSDGKFDNFFLLDIRKDHESSEKKEDGIHVIMECSEDTDKTGDHGLGDFWDDEENYKSIVLLQEGTYGTDFGDTLFEELNDPEYKEMMYFAMAPVVLDGTVRYVVCLEYDWSGFARVLNRNLHSIFLWGGISLLAANILLAVFLYLKVVRPMEKVNDGIHAYMRTKDSEKAVRDMGKIKEKNEVGRLADSIAEMTVEIDRSTRENLRLNSEQERVAAELELAARIQEDCLPREFPDREDVRLSASMTPAKEVGGDFYDFFFIDEGHLGLVIADVSGKGVPAALFMMMSKDLIKNYARMGLPPEEVLNRTNLSLCENNQNRMFVTVWFGILELATGHVTAANGGHEYPILRKANGEFELFREKHGIVLGMIAKKAYTSYEFDIEPGGTLFVYTDGVPEATDARDQMFGTDRMLTALNRDPGAEPDTLLRNMKSAVDQFVGDAPQFDDLTMLCVRRRGCAGNAGEADSGRKAE